MVVLAGARGGWGVLGFRNDEFEPLAVLTFVTRDPARKKLAPGAVGAKLGRVEGYLRREAALFRDFARVIQGCMLLERREAGDDRDKIAVSLAEMSVGGLRAD